MWGFVHLGESLPSSTPVFLHRRRRSLLTSIAPLLAAGLLLGGCGSNGTNVQDTSATRLPGGGARPVEVGFVFRDGDLTPTARKIEATGSVVLVLSAADGRPHGITVQGPGLRTRILLRPSETIRRELKALKPGTRYRLVPDGASPPAVLQVG